MALGWHVKNPGMIGGGRVTRRFETGGRTFKPGEEISREKILAIPIANRNALINAGFIEIFPVSAVGGERFLVPMGKGLFHVVEGRRLSSEPLTKEQADALLSAKSAA